MKEGKKNTFWDFNKELLLGELGSIIFAPLAAFIFSYFTNNTKIISSSAVGGAVFGAVLLWLATRIYDQKQHRTFSAESLARDILYFTPVAFVLSLLIYYPTVYFASNHFLTAGNRVIYSVLGSQLIGFVSFAAAINIYRSILFVTLGKKL